MGFLWKLFSDNWAVILIAPGLFAGAFAVGWLAGWMVIRLVYNQRLAHQSDMITILRAVLEEKLPASFLPQPPRKHSNRMSVGLVLIFVGVIAVIIGAFIVALDKPRQSTKTATVTEPVTPSVIAPVVQNPSPPSPTPSVSSPTTTTTGPVEDVERQQLLKSRGEMELAVRDAGGTPLKHQFNTQSMETIKVSDGSTSYEISTHVAHATAVWLNVGIGSGSAKKLYVSKSAQRGRPIDIRQLRPSKGSDTISIGQRAFIELEGGKILQLLLVGVLWYRAGDDVDEARFKYKIYDAGEFLIDPL